MVKSAECWIECSVECWIEGRVEGGVEGGVEGSVRLQSTDYGLLIKGQRHKGAGSF